MKIFHCDHCGHLLFFENVVCVKCNRTLAFIPELGVVASLDKASEGNWKTPVKRSEGRTYRLCANYTQQNVCNWAIPDSEPHTLCSSCRLTRVVPDLTTPGNHEAWYRLEVAKRRLVYTLMHLDVPLENKDDNPEQGLTFEFLAEAGKPDGKPVLTGHADGVITINVAEADDAERERRRVQMHEPYRTLLGHFRHEVGHYYWDRLIRDSGRLEPFRERFGDDREDYGKALERHYKQGAPADWPQRHVSSYASAHAWEDWAETWAHYLHMIDTLETAAACGVTLKPPRKDEPSLKAVPAVTSSFDRLIDSWFPLTYVLNNLNRGLGQADAYPFVLSPVVVDKLKFIHETVQKT